MDCVPADIISPPKSFRATMGGNSENNIPSDLLTSIAQGLGIIDLLSFRGVCKDWKSASSTASAEIESSPDCEPWFLLYGETSECLLLGSSDKKYTINIPELKDGANCIASNQGWLLLIHQDGSVAFLCPFSRTRIDLPKLPINLESSNCLAAFSSPPTSGDCNVCIFTKKLETDVTSDTEFFLLSRGAHAWTKHTLNRVREFCTLESGSYHSGFQGGSFHFIDDKDNLIIYNVKEEDAGEYKVVNSSKKRLHPSDKLPYCRKRQSFTSLNVKQQLGLEEDVSVSVCGTVMKQSDFDCVITGETIRSPAEESGGIFRRFRGVWIHPRFFLLPLNYTW